MYSPGFALGNTYNYTQAHPQRFHASMVQLTCTMIQLALVVLATIHPSVCGKMKGCARVYGEWILWQYLLSTHASWYKGCYLCKTISETALWPISPISISHILQIVIPTEHLQVATTEYLLIAISLNIF